MATRRRIRLDRATPDSREWKLQVARAIVADRAPYFGTVLFALCPIEVDKIRRVVKRAGGYAIQELDTFGVTDTGLLLYTPAALEAWSQDNLVFVLAHEVLHVLLDHGTRARAAGYDPELFNIAADIFINDQLRAGDWPDHPPSICFPETWGFEPGLTADEYYSLLLDKQQEQREKKEQRQKQGKCPNCGSSDDHGQGDQQSDQGDQQSDQGGQGSDEEEGEQGRSQSAGCPNGPGKIDGEPDITNIGQALKEDSFGNCGSGAGTELDNEKNLSGQAREAERGEGEMDALREAAAAEMAEAARKNPGSVGAGLARWAEARIGPPKVNWRTYMRRAMRRAYEWVIGQEDYLYGQRMHRNQAAFGYGPRSIVQPTMVQPKPKLLIAVDTSGSMGEEELGIALRELDGVCKQLRCRVTVVSCDAEVNEMKECSNWREAAKALKGGGGTSFVPIFEAVDRMREKPDIVAVVTDGWGPAPEREPSGYKTLWLEVGSQATSPCDWGTHVRIED